MGLFQPLAQVNGCVGFNLTALLCSSFSATAFSLVFILSLYLAKIPPGLMYIKIYFGDKPLFLCDSITPDIEPYLHHDDAVFIEEFSTPAVNAMIYEMQLPGIHAGIFQHHDLAALDKAFRKKFLLVKAGGGVVWNEEGQLLFIHRR